MLSTDFDVPEGLCEHRLPECTGVERVEKTHVEVMEVGLDGGTLHDQVLCHPVIVLLLYQASELLHLVGKETPQTHGLPKQHMDCSVSGKECGDCGYDGNTEVRQN